MTTFDRSNKVIPQARKTKVKRAVRYLLKNIHWIILISLIAMFTVIGILVTSEKIAQGYYNSMIAPFVYAQAQAPENLAK